MPYIYLKEVKTPMRLLKVRIFIDSERKWYVRIRNGRLKQISLRG